MIVAPNSPIPRASESAAPGSEAAGGKRQRDAEERPARSGPERARGGQHHGVDRLEGGDRLTQVERPGDEKDREHNGDLREADLDSERVERAAQQAKPAKGREEPDPGDGRRQHQWQLGEREDQRATRKAPGGDEVGGGRAHEQRQREGDPVRLRRHRQRIEDDAIVEPAEQLSGRDAQEDRGDRQEQEAERECSGEPCRDRERQTFHGRRKPAAARCPRPTSPRTRATNARAAVAWRLARTTAIS